jgi:hypothetical protein
MRDLFNKNKNNDLISNKANTLKGDNTGDDSYFLGGEGKMRSIPSKEHKESTSSFSTHESS